MSTIRVLLIAGRDEPADRIAALLQSASPDAAIRFAADRLPDLDAAQAELARRRHDAILFDSALGAETALDLTNAARAAGLPSLPVIALLDGPVEADQPPPGAADAIGTTGLSAVLLRRVVRHAVERARGLGALQESEERLVHAQRMESLGRLVGGVAHDFNNLLTGILGYASILERETPRDQPNRRPIEEIRKAAELASNLTRQLLAYSRKQTTRKVALDINSVIDGLADMLKRLVGEHVSLEMQRMQDLAPVLADPGQIEQIVLNLVLNARDATRPGGRIALATSTTILADSDARREGLPRGGLFVRLSLQDSGAGMTPAALTHLFEPYFTTKPLGKGTGLGLASVQMIARQSGGFVTVSSAPGEGTLVSVWLPVAEPESAPASTFATVADYRGTERVLVVEDDETVRTFVREALTFYGYRPLLAAEPSTALRLVQESSEPIAVLLTDIVLPDMSGMHLAQQLTALRPGLEVVFMSGYIDAKSGHVALPPDANFLRKPFAPDELAQMLRRVIDLAVLRAARGAAF